MGQKQKTERKREKERKLVKTMASYALPNPPRVAHASRLGQFLSELRQRVSQNQSNNFWIHISPVSLLAIVNTCFPFSFFFSLYLWAPRKLIFGKQPYFNPTRRSSKEKNGSSKLFLLPAFGQGRLN